MQPAVAKKVKAVVTMASPGPYSSAIRMASKRVGARRNTDRMRRAAIFCHRLLEFRYLRPQDKALICQHLVDGLPNRLRQQSILVAQVEKRDTHGAKTHDSFTRRINRSLPAYAWR